jgi:hypothetical protein
MARIAVSIARELTETLLLKLSRMKKITGWVTHPVTSLRIYFAGL